MLTPLNELAFHIHKNAKAKGWWDDERQFPEIVALIHSEVSEALEEWRNGHDTHEIYFPDSGGHGPQAPDETYAKNWAEQFGWKPEGVPIELADVIIRILDYAGHLGLDIDRAVELKMEYNKTRPHRHGGKRA